MNREIHVRFREGVGVRFPRATRPVLVFARREDAERVMEVLPKRFGKYGLTIHPEKTRMIRFGMPGRRDGETQDRPSWEKFNFLGFTHYWGQSRKGRWVVMRKTETARLTRALNRVREWCRRNRHLPLGAQQDMLAMKMRGHYQYYGLTGNWRSLNMFYNQVQRIWRKWLMRRTRRHLIRWEQFREILRRYPLPTARMAHAWHAAKL